MSRVLVLYDSETGNTAQMATLVGEGAGQVSDTEVKVIHVQHAKAEDVIWCDGIAVGSPTNIGVISWKMKRFWDVDMLDHWMKIDGKIGCAFSSSGAWGGGTELACQSILTVLINYGFLVFGVTDYAGKLTTSHYGAIAVRQPRDPDVKNASRLLGRRLAEWVSVYIAGRRTMHPVLHPSARSLPT